MARKAELREFLRSRRGRLQPEAVGLPAIGYRRVPGLRREEVAMLAGMSVDYYTRLEQGRVASPSDSVLDALARALGLEAVERAHLYALVRSSQSAPASDLANPPTIRPDVQRLLDSLKTPALVIGRGTSVLGSNALVRGLIADFDAMPLEERYYAHWLFANPVARNVFEDRWEGYARETVAVLRRDTSRWPKDTVLQAFIGRLSIISSEFGTWWSQHDVETHHYGSKRYNHPIVGDITVFHEATRLSEGDQYLFLYSVEPGSPSEDAMRLLESWVATEAEPKDASHATALGSRLR
jgi:transcriptional regulator with XRE-family HTH domain